MRTFLFGCVFILLAYSVVGQTKPSAIKFDEFVNGSKAQYFFDDEIAFKERTRAFINHIRQKKATRVFIIYYRARVASASDQRSISNLAERAAWDISYDAKLDHENVEVVDGGLRDRGAFEFWFAPRNAVPPVATPKYTREEGIECPDISGYSEGPRFDNSKPVIFRAYIHPEGSHKLTWTLSEGTITEGQGTQRIEVDPASVSASRITASFTVALPSPCHNSEIVTVDLKPGPFLSDGMDRFNESVLRGRLDSFLTEIISNAAYQGVIIVYGGRNRGRVSLDAAAKLVQNHLAFRRFPMNRVKIVKGGYRDYPGFESWLMLSGMEMPKPTPSVDSTIVERRIVKGPRKK
ncbi:MAG TPA: hypothetical protein VGQ55_10195 [Pyrinomonadaceae bacterium]|nr:hypothetical protein [Pyrinomonadaceae bacterium]